MAISAVGQRSFVIQSALLEAGTRRRLLLHRASCICTSVDAATGRRSSAPLPAWFLEAHAALGPGPEGQGHAGASGRTLEGWPSRLAPDGGPTLWRGEARVRASDTDVNGHVNNVVYATYALDAAADAARAGLLPELGTDAAGHRIRASQVQYDGEAYWGDVLEVRLTRRAGSRDARRLTVAFEISRPSTGDKLLTLGTVTFITAPARNARL